MIDLSTDRKREDIWLALAAAVQVRDFGMLWRKMWAMYYLNNPDKRKNYATKAQD